MRYNYPISSDEIKDELRSIYMDMTNLIGYSTASGVVQASGVYDAIDDEIDELKYVVTDNTTNKKVFNNVIRTITDIQFLKG